MDIIWGNVGKVLSGQIFELNVTHKKNANKNDYSEIEKIKVIQTDIMSLPVDLNECTIEQLEQNLGGSFVKCEIKNRENDGTLKSVVSHSGQGGY